MNSFFLLQTAGTGAATGGAMGGSLVSTLIPFALIILIFYFLIIRPQNKKQKETQRMLSALKKGDKIITIGGIHGVIYSVKDDSVVVKVDDGTRIEFSRSAVSSVTPQGKAAEAPAAPAEKPSLGSLFGFGKKKEAAPAAEAQPEAVDVEPIKDDEGDAAEEKGDEEDKSSPPPSSSTRIIA
jgi:preprotein translocase subunit YajC